MAVISVAIALQLVLWAANFISNVIALFISLFLLISQYDLKESSIAPVELANSYSKVIIHLINNALF